MALRGLRATLAAALAPSEERAPPGPLVEDFLIGQELPPPSSTYRQFARDGMKRNEVVFALIREIATSFAEFRMKAWVDGRAQPAHPFRRLIARPNPFHKSEYVLWEVAQTYYQLAGEAFFFRARNPAGVTAELWPMRPDKVGYVPAKAGASHPVDHWFYQSMPGSKRVPMDVRDVIHLKIPDPEDEVRGLSPARVAAGSIDADNRATDFTRSFMANQGVLAGALKVNRDYDADLQKRLIKQWRQRHAGAENAGKMMVLWNDTEYQQFAVSPRMMEFGDLRGITETRIAMCWGVSPIVIQSWAGIAHNTFTNHGEARHALYDEKILPDVRKWEDVFAAEFVYADPAEEPDVRGLQLANAEIAFDRSEIRALQESEDAKWTRIGNAFQKSLMGWRQAQGELGISETPDDDIVFVNLATAPTIAGDVGTPPPDPNATPAPGSNARGLFIRAGDLRAYITGDITEDQAEERAIATTAEENEKPRKKRKR